MNSLFLRPALAAEMARQLLCPSVLDEGLRSGVIWLIADLDRPQEGALTVNQQALIDVRASMNAQQ